MQAIAMTRQRGVTLIEVLVSMLILAVGLLGAAALQVNALKYTDSSLMTSQASFIAYDMLDRMRANPDGAYTVTQLSSINATASATAARDVDLYDFKTNIASLDANGTGTITINNQVVTITIGWSDSRAANVTATAADGASRSFTLTSRIATTPLVTP